MEDFIDRRMRLLRFLYQVEPKVDYMIGLLFFDLNPASDDTTRRCRLQWDCAGRMPTPWRQ